jgi:hypothetical protein
MRRELLVGAALAVLVAGCSKPETPSIIGHWQAERQTVYSAHLPVGPDIEISNDAITVPGTTASIPLTAIEMKSDEAVLDMPLDVGLSFYFDGPDRVHLKVPLLGNIYYRRVHDRAPARALAQASAVIQPVATAAGVQPASALEPVAAAQSKVTGTPAAMNNAHAAGAAPFSADYQLALQAASQGNQDQAIDELNKAFKLGFNDFDRIDTAPEFAALRTDIRYQALVARYR